MSLTSISVEASLFGASSDNGDMHDNNKEGQKELIVKSGKYDSEDGKALCTSILQRTRSTTLRIKSLYQREYPMANMFHQHIPFAEPTSALQQQPVTRRYPTRYTSRFFPLPEERKQDFAPSNTDARITINSIRRQEEAIVKYENQRGAGSPWRSASFSLQRKPSNTCSSPPSREKDYVLDPEVAKALTASLPSSRSSRRRAIPVRSSAHNYSNDSSSDEWTDDDIFFRPQKKQRSSRDARLNRMNTPGRGSRRGLRRGHKPAPLTIIGSAKDFVPRPNLPE